MTEALGDELRGTDLPPAVAAWSGALKFRADGSVAPPGNDRVSTWTEVPEMKEENVGAIEKHERAAPMTHEDDIGHLMKLAQTLSTACGMVPEALAGNPGNILAALLTGRELGLAPMASLRGLHIVKGKVGANYDTMVGLLRRAGYRVEWPSELQSDASVTLRLTHPDGSTHEETWDRARATSAGLWNSSSTWKKYTRAMLRARCVSSAGRAFAGDVLAGVYSTDEVREIEGRGPAEVHALPVTKESAPPSAASEVAALREPVAAGEMSTDDARARIWAAIEAAPHDDARRAIAKAAMDVVLASGVPREEAIAVRNRWVKEPAPDGEELTDEQAALAAALEEELGGSQDEAFAP